MSRKPAFLAALASSAVPGLDPVSVRAARRDRGHQHEVAFVTDTQDRRWVVRAPVTAAAGAQMDTTVALLGLLGRRLPFAVPAPRGFAAVPEGRAVVYPFIPGRPIDFAALPAGSGLSAEIGRAIAALHNIDRLVFDEAGLPAYDAEEFRNRKLADLDRGAATGHVPTSLLSRWESALEDVSTWRFAPTPIHGGITGEQVLVVFADENDARSGTVRGLTGWDDAKVADPAEDFASLATACSPETFESILEAYAHSRVERPDRHLRRRARLAAELRLLGDLLSAVNGGRRDLLEECAEALRDLDEATIDEQQEQDEPSAPTWLPTAAAASPTAPVAPTPAVLPTNAEPPPSDSDQTQPINAGWFSDPTVVIAEPPAPASAPAPPVAPEPEQPQPEQAVGQVAEPEATADAKPSDEPEPAPGPEPAPPVRIELEADAKPEPEEPEPEEPEPDPEPEAEPEPVFREPPDRFR